jgi:hypothetical protein
MRGRLGIRTIALVGVLVAAVALAADVVVENWSTAPVGAEGIPPGWQKQGWGEPEYDLTVVAENSVSSA